MADSTSSTIPPFGTPGDFYNSLVTDPFYVIQKGYLDSTGTLAKSTLDTQSANAQRDEALSLQRIQFNLADTQRGITNDLADRQATESGDAGFYHGHANQLASFDTQAAANQLQDYLAGVQAAYAQGVLDRQFGQQGDLYAAYQREVQYYQNLNGGNPPPPDPNPPPPDGGGNPPPVGGYGPDQGVFQSGGNQYIVPR